MTMNMTNSDYSKAYYNQRKRNRVNLKMEKISIDLAKFIFKNDEEDFARLFKNDFTLFTSLNNLDSETKSLNFLVLRNPLDRIRGYLLLGDGRQLKGDLEDLVLNNEDLDKLESLGIETSKLR